MQKRVFLITDGVVLDQDLYSFKYRSDLFDQYLSLNKITDPICLTDMGIEDYENISYEKILTSLYYESEFKNAQIVDMSHDHIKFTKYYTQHKALTTTSVKIMIDERDLIQSMTSIPSNKLQYINQGLNWIVQRTCLDTGFNVLNSFLLSAYIKQVKDQIDFSIPLIILTDLTLKGDVKNFANIIYSNLNFHQDIYIYSKSDAYIFAHKYKDNILSPIMIKCVSLKANKNSICATVELKNNLDYSKISILSNQVKVFEVNTSQLIKVYDIHKKALFESTGNGVVVLNSYDYPISKKNK